MKKLVAFYFKVNLLCEVVNFFFPGGRCAKSQRGCPGGHPDPEPFFLPQPPADTDDADVTSAASHSHTSPNRKQKSSVFKV